MTDTLAIDFMIGTNWGWKKEDAPMTCEDQV
ncbi:hypothetical protein QFZ42_004420 [Variovorax paradoxus]|nr:hypothetical protein [Variovorax paradoxus]